MRIFRAFDDLLVISGLVVLVYIFGLDVGLGLRSLIRCDGYATQGISASAFRVEKCYEQFEHERPDILSWAAQILNSDSLRIQSLQHIRVTAGILADSPDFVASEHAI